MSSKDEANAATIVRDLLEEVVDALDLEADVEIREHDGQIEGEVVGDELGLFIGRHGQTIDAVQHLAVRAVLHQTGEQERIVVDAAGYRARRQETLERQADRAADEAVQYDRAVSLDAMTAAERKLVHEFLRERGGVETHSEGDEPDRRLVVSPAAAGE